VVVEQGRPDAVEIDRDLHLFEPPDLAGVEAAGGDDADRPATKRSKSGSKKSGRGSGAYRIL